MLPSCDGPSNDGCAMLILKLDQRKKNKTKMKRTCLITGDNPYKTFPANY